jgi:hypothetical protein
MENTEIILGNGDVPLNNIKKNERYRLTTGSSLFRYSASLSSFQIATLLNECDLKFIILEFDLPVSPQPENPTKDAAFSCQSRWKGGWELRPIISFFWFTWAKY